MMLQNLSNSTENVQVERRGEANGNTVEDHRRQHSPLAGLWSGLKSRLQFSDAGGLSEGNPAPAPPTPQIEDFRPGYPQFSALIASHTSFHVLRRFVRIRARLLLLKQDELSLLEHQLDRIDHGETRELFLGNRRRDRNSERKDILGKIEIALASYDAVLDSNRRALAFDEPRKADVTNIQNWVKNTSSLAEDETAYLSESKDLMTILSPQDAALARLTPLLERVVRTWYRLFRKPQSDISRDPNISLFRDSVLQRLTRALIASVVVILLLVPIAVLNALASTGHRMAVIVIAAASFIVMVSGFTNAKTVEVLVSGATYATVLVVFISGNGIEGT